MFDTFAQGRDFQSLPSFSREVFLRFVNRANKSFLHPLDMRRFYHFVRLCHARHVKLDRFQVRAHLICAGFDEDAAEHLSDVYYHGRELLKFGRVPVRKTALVPHET